MRVAVLLNRNAKGVSDDVVRAVEGVAGPDLYLTSDLTEARMVARRVVERGYETVLLGGGDGTFVNWTSDIIRFADAFDRPAPRFAILPLGTGNALATSLGTSASSPWALRQVIRNARESQQTRPLPLLEVEGKLSPSAGFGLDALILEDHRVVARAFGSLGMRVSGNASYALSVLTRSIPRFAVVDYPEITITNIGEPAYAVDIRGEPLGEPIPAGDVLFRGRASIASASTIPYVGLQLKLYPHAERLRGRYHLRVSDLGVMEILRHLGPLWRGTYSSHHIHDFLCSRVLMEVSEATPMQIGGDLVGLRSSTVISLAQERVRVVS